MYNHDLADERGLSDEYRAVLKDVYTQLDALLKRPEMYAGTGLEAVERCHGLEYTLQFLWGFDLNDKMHRYDYRLRDCTCPIMDNDDRLGVDERIHLMNCPFHGVQSFKRLPK